MLMQLLQALKTQQRIQPRDILQKKQINVILIWHGIHPTWYKRLILWKVIVVGQRQINTPFKIIWEEVYIRLHRPLVFDQTIGAQAGMLLLLISPTISGIGLI